MSDFNQAIQQLLGAQQSFHGVAQQQQQQQQQCYPQATIPVRVTGKQFVVVCVNAIEYADTMEAAQQAAEKLAHQHQTEAFVLSPVLKVAPKRDTVSTPIKL